MVEGGGGADLQEILLPAARAARRFAVGEHAALAATLLRGGGWIDHVIESGA